VTATREQFLGCILGLAMGDALGAPHEGGLLEGLLWRLIGHNSEGHLRWTDDTQMALDLAESLLEENGVRPEALARRIADGYRWSRGYGPGTARVLRRIRRGEAWTTAATAVYPRGSLGNGAAVRSPVVALFYASDREQLLSTARSAAQVTHTHPLGIEGAILVALATHALLNGKNTEQVLEVARSACGSPEFQDKLQAATCWLLGDDTPTPAEVARRLGNGMTAAASCPTALYIALRHLRSRFDDMIRFVIACKGDVDSIAAMAGAFWGAANGTAVLPTVKLESRDRLEDVGLRLFVRYRTMESARR
jgi:poly(ADP-ribose) glycohydrolase ARH3